MKKSNLKSVRISDEVMNFILDFEGDGFNQKFENLVLYFMKEEEAKKQKLSRLDAQIQKKIKQLDVISGLAFQCNTTINAMVALNDQIDEILPCLEKLSG